MATTTLNSRFQLKHDTLANWLLADPILLPGEVAVAYLDSNSNADGVGKDSSGLTPPAVGIKIGATAGDKRFSELNWIQAIAGDVYAWAKAATKPVYTASEIDGLESFITGEIQDTDTQYRMTLVDGVLHLQSKAKGAADTTFADVSTITLPTDALAEGSTNGTVAFNGTDVRVHGLKSAAYTESSAYATSAQGAKADSALQGVTLGGTDLVVNVDKKVALTLENLAAVGLAKTTDLGSTNTAVEAAQTAADNAQAAAEAAQGTADNAVSAAQAAQNDVNTLAGKVGTVPAGQTVMGIISNIQGNVYDDTEIRGLISNNEGAIDAVEGRVDILIGSDVNKSVRTIANEELAAQLIAPDAAESLNTLAEIAAWIQAHPDDAAAMNEAITALQKQLQGIAAGEGTVKTYVDTAESDAVATAKTYTDSQIGEAKTYAEGRASAAETVARGYADELIAGLDSSISATAGSVLTGVTVTDGKITNKTEVALATVATTGNVNDLVQTTGDYLIFNGGTATTVI